MPGPDRRYDQPVTGVFSANIFSKHFEQEFSKNPEMAIPPESPLL